MQNYDDDATKEIERCQNNFWWGKETLDEVGDKIKAGTKTVGNKIKDLDRDLDTEYDNEKLKEDLT